MKPVLEMLAGVPTVVYGYFAALTVAPAVRELGLTLGIANASSESALAAGAVMGIMIIPFVSSMADDSIAAVPAAMRDGSLAMGATSSETIRKVILPAALPGVVGGILLAVSRAIGDGNVQAINYFVAQKYVDALETIGSARNSKLILMPLEASSMIGSVAGLAEIAKEALSDNGSAGGNSGATAAGTRPRGGSVPSAGND